MSEVEKLRKFLETADNGLPMTQADFARRLGYEPPYINKIMAGFNPITDSLRWRVQCAFGVEVALQLFGNGQLEEAEVTA
jgi:transcriptional regulator with XRE-family HTH domain